MLRDVVQPAFSSPFKWVTCFQSPIDPAQISGGRSKESRMAADFFRSGVTESASAESSVQRVLVSPDAGSSDATATLPSTFSINRMRFEGSHVSHLGEAFRRGVRLRGGPPPAGTTKISPPFKPSSLINPPMKATLRPSGDQRGMAICIEVLRMDVVLPVAALMV